MTGVISAVIRFREWPALCGELCVRVRVYVRVCARAGGRGCMADSLSFTGYPVRVGTVEMEN